MAGGPFTFYDAAKNNLLAGNFNFSSGNYQAILATASYSPDIQTDSAYSNVSGNEVAAGGGYSTGGVALSGLTLYYLISATALPTIVAGGSGYAVSSTFNVNVSGGTSSTAAVVNVTTNASGVVTTVNSVTTQGDYSVLPSNPVATTGGTGTGLTLSLTWDVAFNAAAIGYGSNTTITAKYLVVVHKAGGSLVAGDLLVGYVDLNVGGGAVNSTNSTFQVSPAAVGLFTLE